VSIYLKVDGKMGGAAVQKCEIADALGNPSTQFTCGHGGRPGEYTNKYTSGSDGGRDGYWYASQHGKCPGVACQMDPQIITVSKT
jgi:hypothetical protein